VSEVEEGEGSRAATARASAALRDLVAGLPDLGARRTEALFGDIMAGHLDAAQIAGLLTALAVRGETPEEIRGAAIAMRGALVDVPVGRPVIDTCGTGGSGVPRRNVSTAAAVAVAACDVAVAKHGNRAASSRSGSADVLEALGVNIAASPATVARCVELVGVGFLFARALHPAMGHAAPVRRALGIPTLFNLLGPMTNPARAARQVIGVFDPTRLHDIAAALGAMGSERVFVVHGFRAGVEAETASPRGIDDLSPEGASLVVEWHNGERHEHRLTPADAGLESHPLSALAGGDPGDNAQAMRQLFDGDAAGDLAAYRSAVIFAGALGLAVAGDEPLTTLPTAARRIAAAIDEGRARETLQKLVELSHDDRADA